MNKITRVCSPALFNHYSSSYYSKRLASTILQKDLFGISLISINRPEKINAIDLETLKKLREAIDKFENDAALEIGVLYGQNGNFSSGFDLEELAENNYDIHIFKYFEKEFLQRPSKKPIIAAVSGYAVAQGLDLALWCDLRLIENTSLLGFLNRRFGILTSSHTIQTLQSIIGTSRAMEMIMRGKCITAHQAFDWGICNKMVSVGTAIGEGVDNAKKLMYCPQAGMLADRNFLLSHKFSPINTKLSDSEWKDMVRTDYVKSFLDGKFGRHGKFNIINVSDAQFMKSIS